MYCSNCGSSLLENAKSCSVCGVSMIEQTNNTNNEKRCLDNDSINLIGFSPKISDSAFAKYLKNTNRWAWIFSLIIAFAAITGFYIYGETGSEMDNPEALYIGLVIGGMFLLIAVFTTRGRGKSVTWDGTVSGKKILKKRRGVNSSNDDHCWVNYMEYIVYIQSNQGKMHTINVEDDDTLYNYYQIGDKIRYHGGLNSYEKYDKSKDNIIFCNACATLNDITEDYCFRCKCPLLK